MKKAVVWIGALALVGSLAACNPPEGAARAGDADPARTVQPGDTPGGGSMMGGGRRGGMMGGRMGGMMGGGTGDAPAAEASPASGGDCPDVTQALVDQGQQVFNQTGGCTACHGRDAKGTALAPDLTDDQWLNVDGTYGTLAELIRTGVPQPKQHPAPMPPKGGASLSDAQVCAVAAYVYSLSH